MSPWNWKSYEPNCWSTGWGPLTLEVLSSGNNWIWKIKIAREVSEWDVIWEGTESSLLEARMAAEKYASDWVLG